MSIEVPTLSATPDAREPGTQGAKTDIGHPGRYAILQQHLVDNPGVRFWTDRGIAAFEGAGHVERACLATPLMRRVEISRPAAADVALPRCS